MFLIESGALEGRIDPNFYKISIVKSVSKIYENISLKKIAILKKGQSITKNSIIDGEYPVIAGGQTSPYSHESYNNEFAITVSASGAYAGFVWWHPYKFFASDCTVIKSKDENIILTTFLVEILKLKQTEIYNLQQGSAQPHVYASDLGNILIPLPDLSTQQKIVDLFSLAYESKKAKEAEAKQLLEGIDAYLLDKLGIQTSRKLETFGKLKHFFVNFSQVQGNRFDPFYHKVEFEELDAAIAKSNWDIVALKDLFQINRGGSPRPIEKYLTEEDNGVNWIKIGDTKNDDMYVYSTSQKIKPEGTKHSRQVLVGDFILSNSMSFGKPYIMKIDGYIHDGWLLLRPKIDNVNNYYLHAILGSKLMYKLFKRLTIGGVVDNLNIDLVKSVKIPLPPLSVQAEIADYISGVRGRAKALGEEAKNELEKAKLLVEEMILG